VQVFLLVYVWSLTLRKLNFSPEKKEVLEVTQKSTSYSLSGPNLSTNPWTKISSVYALWYTDKVLYIVLPTYIYISCGLLLYSDNLFMLLVKISLNKHSSVCYTRLTVCHLIAAVRLSCLTSCCSDNYNLLWIIILIERKTDIFLIQLSSLTLTVRLPVRLMAQVMSY
jgi:hypothetical protein